MIFQGNHESKRKVGVVTAERRRAGRGNPALRRMLRLVNEQRRYRRAIAGWLGIADRIRRGLKRDARKAGRR